MKFFIPVLIVLGIFVTAITFAILAAIILKIIHAIVKFFRGR